MQIGPGERELGQALPASRGDVWISDGLARYSEALYAEQNAGKEAGLKAVDEFAVGALMYEEAAPIARVRQARQRPAGLHVLENFRDLGADPRKILWVLVVGHQATVLPIVARNRVGRAGLCGCCHS